MTIHVIRRKRAKSFWGRLMPSAVCVLVIGVLIRLFTLSELGGALERWMLNAGRDPGLVTGVLDFETRGWPGGEDGLTGMLRSQSAFLSSLVIPPPAADAGDVSPADADTVVSDVQDENTPVLDAEEFYPPGLVFWPANTAVPSPSAPAPTGTPAGVYTPPPANIVEVSFNPKSGDGFDAAQGVYVHNETSLNIDVSALLAKTPPVRLAGDGPQILIIHTHGSESFQSDEEYPYTPTDVERTEDTNFNVVRVGDEMQKIFEAQGLRVIHDRSIHDEPTYNGSYGRSLKAIEKIIKENPGISVVIDLHRDSIQAGDGRTYKPITMVDGRKVAQGMFVIGTNDSGLDHPNWKQNLTLAVQLQKRLNTAYPGLMRPINLRSQRFNEHATTGSMLLEVGSSGNTLGEAIATAQLFAEVTGEYLKQLTDNS